jgi:membrane protein DedA with SNARE-associated domain
MLKWEEHKIFVKDFKKMTHFLHSLFALWFQWVHDWGYWGIFLLMAMESSIFPVPSELIMPPAAFWATQGRLSMLAVWLAGTLGSLAGSLLTYGAAAWFGEKSLLKWGSKVGIKPQGIAFAQHWSNKLGAWGVFFARLLPVLRHVISIPCGLLGMSLVPFILATTIGSGIWCACLAWAGQRIIGDHPEILESTELLLDTLKKEMRWILLFVGVMAALFTAVLMLQNKFKKSTT